VFQLSFRAVIIIALLALALHSGQHAPSDPLGALLTLLPALFALVATLFSVEARPRLRPFLGVAWVVVFDLVVLALMLATLGETADAELLSFLLLGVVVATSRDLLAGALSGALAAAGFVYLAWRHGLVATHPSDPLILARAGVFLAVGVFTGFLSREAEQERAVRAEETASLREQLADLGEYLKNVLSCVASGVLVVDAQGRVTTFNRAAERILGLPSHKAMGRALGEVEELRDLDVAFRAVTGPVETPPRADLELPARGERRALRIGYALTPLENLAGRRLGWILVFQDVTLIRDYEARLLHQEKLAALGRLVSGIAHEFGNLLGGARGHVDLALATGAPEDAVEALPIVRDTLGRALVTVEHLLRFARGTPLHRVPGVDLRQVVDQALHLLSVELEKAGVEVERRFSPHPALSADAGQLEQVVVNLVINAVHALSGAQSKRLRMTVEPCPGGARLVVEDSGPGVPEPLRPRIFDPFFTTKGALGGSSVPGTGLGLSTSLGIVEGHEGRLVVGSSPDMGGASFTVTLPSTGGDGVASS
jgi:PAS domain S-box-containing protein